MITVEDLAKELHEAGRAAVESGATVAADKFGETARKFMEWDEISESAREGRRIQAKYLLDKFPAISCGSRTLTCVYCGMAYPQGTPTNGAQVLTDHIKVCAKHPMRKAEGDIAKLRKAIMDMLGGESSRAELEQMELLIRAAQVPDIDKTISINAIHALLETE